MASRSDGHSNTDQHQDGKLDQESQHRMGEKPKQSEANSMTWPFPTHPLPPYKEPKGPQYPHDAEEAPF